MPHARLTVIIVTSVGDATQTDDDAQMRARQLRASSRGSCARACALPRRCAWRGGVSSLSACTVGVAADDEHTSSTDACPRRRRCPLRAAADAPSASGGRRRGRFRAGGHGAAARAAVARCGGAPHASQEVVVALQRFLRLRFRA
jgi:hypothetical protein